MPSAIEANHRCRGMNGWARSHWILEFYGSREFYCFPSGREIHTTPTESKLEYRTVLAIREATRTNPKSRHSWPTRLGKTAVLAEPSELPPTIVAPIRFDPEESVQ